VPRNNNKTKNLKQKLQTLPQLPGIYKFKNAAGHIIYVGKAKNLKSRVNSYFQDNLDPISKTAALVQNITDLEIIETLSELEALILEAELIKKYKPKYNIAYKDDKSYLYIVIRSEKVELNGKAVSLPKVLAVRETDLEPKDVSFGPFPNTRTARYVVRTIRRVFPYRDCSLSKFNKYKKLGQPCLWGHIGLCQAPCVGNIAPDDYKKEVNQIKKLLSGQSSILMRDLEKAMKGASKTQEYEQATKYRNILDKFHYIRQKNSAAQKYIDNPYLVQDLREKSLSELVKNITILNHLPHRIECYDISNISGTFAVGSMVVAIGGELDKSEYRKFKIKQKKTPDDYAMLTEVLDRRLNNTWQLPDLLVIDGGKGQVGAVQELLNIRGVDIPVIGLAKKQETIVYQTNPKKEFKEINLSRDNDGLKLLQRLRDEAHRFAQSYHHKLRLKSIQDKL
jgi:excinuclease ABC subunit C